MKRIASALAVVLALAFVVGAAEKAKSELSLTLPKSVTLKPGESKEVTVKIDRDGFDEEVSVKFDDLPKGVKVDKPTQKIKKGEKSADYVLIAGTDAAAGEHKVKVTASAKELKVTKDVVVTIEK